MHALVFTSLLLLASAPLTLEQAVEQALSRNERAQIAWNQREVAEARWQQARAFFFPTLDVTGAYTRRPGEVVRNVGGNSLVVQAADALNATATLRWTFFDARGIPLFQSARRGLEAAEHDEKDARRNLGLDAARAFLMTLASTQVHEAAQRRYELAQKSLSEAEARFTAQLVSVNDVTRAKLEKASALREVTRTDGMRQLALAQLGFLIHAETPLALERPTALLTFAEAEENTPPEEDALSQARTRRPDFLSILARAEAAERLTLEPHLRHLPALSLRGTSRLTNEPGIVGRVLDGSAGVDLTWTLFDQGLRYADAHERNAQARVERLRAQAMERAIGVEVRTALVELKSARGALTQAQVAAQSAQLNADEMAELYRRGLARALEVADAAVRLFEAEVALAEERFKVALSLLQLRAAQGLDTFGNPVTP